MLSGSDCVEFKPVENSKVLDEAESPATSGAREEVTWGFHMSDSVAEKVRVVYENGVFKPLQKIKLQEGTTAFVVLKAGKITDAVRKFRIKVDRDVMQEFVEERR